jgi:S-adenosylmethionine hydrolase
LHADHFGNLITNITAADLPELAAGEGKLTISVGNGQVTKVVETFAQGAAGEVVGLMGSSGYLELSVNKGNASRTLGAGRGAEISVEIKAGK